MKIAKISIKNFRGISETVIDVKDVNILIGPCGACKSSTLDAIKWALTGQVSCEDIKIGEKEAFVEIFFEDGTTVSRCRNFEKQTVKVNYKATTQKNCDEYIESKLGCSVQVINSMCGVDFFESLDQRNITKFILDLLPVSISFDKMIEFAQEQIGRKLNNNEIEFLKKRFDITDAIVLSDIDRIYTTIYDDRKVAKNTLKILEAKASFDKTKLPYESREMLNNRMQELSMQEIKAKEYKKNFEAYERSIKAKSEAEKRLLKLKEDLNKYEMVNKPAQEELINAKSDRQKFVDAVKKSENIISTNQANISMFKKTLDNLDKSVCPLSDKLKCSTDKTGLKTEMNILVEKNEAAISQAREFIQKCNEQIAKRDASIETYNRNIVEWTKKEALIKQIKEFVIPTVLEKPELEEFSDSSAEKKEIQDKLKVWSDYETSLEYEKEYEKVFKEFSMLDFGINILDVKKGVRSKILEKSLLSIENIVNEKANSLRHGFKLSFSCSKGIEINISPKGKDFIPMKKVSSGEFIFTAYLLMVAVHQITGASILIIDNIDKLDKESTESFINIIKEDKEFDTIFVAGVNHADTVDILNNITASSTNLIKL